MYSVRVDEKGRLKLPAPLHEHLGKLGETKVYVTTFDARIARIYPISVWNGVEALLRKPGEDAESADDLWFMATAFGDDAEVDAQGRLLLPSELRKRLGLEGQPVRLQFYKGHINVFSEAIFEAKMQRALTSLDEKLGLWEKKGLQ